MQCLTRECPRACIEASVSTTTIKRIHHVQVVLCRIKPGQSPFWGTWVPRWDFYGIVFNAWLRPTVKVLDGSILLNILYCMIGTRIGKRVFLYGTAFTESDLVCNILLSTFQKSACVNIIVNFVFSQVAEQAKLKV